MSTKRPVDEGTVSSNANEVLMRVTAFTLCTADFHLAELSPLQLDAVAREDRRTRAPAVRKLHDVGNSTFVLSVENDNDFRSRCE